MRDFIRFLPNARDALFRICLSPSRQEQVGLLLGDDTDVRHVVALTNLRPVIQGHGFRIAQGEIDRLRDAHSGHTVLGRFHTHPNTSARPSNSDIASLPPGWCEVIVRLSGRWQAPQVAQIHGYCGADVPISVMFQERAA
ncbi:MAG: Mov34/MPN/PAD-1 family protein [Roseovarius sp.]|jgi:proteasome lid subunit RPN8/RPN11|nr:Mov34/MPN/PAD-1 family protein [Roseovarius sp.]